MLHIEENKGSRPVCWRAFNVLYDLWTFRWMRYYNCYKWLDACICLRWNIIEKIRIPGKSPDGQTVNNTWYEYENGINSSDDGSTPKENYCFEREDLKTKPEHIKKKSADRKTNRKTFFPLKAPVGRSLRIWRGIGKLSGFHKSIKLARISKARIYRWSLINSVQYTTPRGDSCRTV